MAKIHPRTTTNVGKDAEQQGLPFTAGGNENGAPLWKTVWQILTKLNIAYHMIQQSHPLVFTQVR